MRRDSIFYKLFSQFPGLLFELMDHPPAHTVGYQFESIEVKETAFRIDGVFLPPDETIPSVVCFAEVQLQKDEELYDRFFAETSYFLRRAKGRYHYWQGVILLASRSLEPANAGLHYDLLHGQQVQRLYLDELPPSADSLGLQLIQMIMAEEPAAVAQAQALLQQVPSQIPPELSESAIIDLITTIIVYKLSTASREEIEAMLGLNLSESRVLQEERQQGLQQGRQEEGRSLILRLLTRRFGLLPDSTLSHINTLSLEQLEALAEALLDFAALADLTAWLEERA
jgi:predicted transposase/invertase (TIGR01784 family)